MSNLRNLAVLCFSVILVSSVLGEAADAAKPTLVINIHRHGARGPKERDIDPNWDPNLYAQLTPVGQRQLYLLGAALAKRYPHLLRNPFDRNLVYVRTSESTRCVQSAAAQLYGAIMGTGVGLDKGYPTERAVPPFDPSIVADILKENVDSQVIKGGYVPIAMTSYPMKEDIVLRTPSTCPAAYLDLRKTVPGKEFLNFWFTTFAPTREALRKKGFNFTNPFDLTSLVDTLWCNHFQNRPLPGGIEYGDALFNNLTLGSTWMLVHAAFSTDFQKAILPVPLLDEVLRHLDAKAAGKAQTKFVFLSTHDDTLLTILASLGIVNNKCLRENFESKVGQPLPHPECIFPPFAANILFEFYDNAGSQSVVLKYNDIAIPLCNGKTECSYKDFKALVKKATNNYTVEDYKKKCLNGAVEDIKWIIEELKKIFKTSNGFLGKIWNIIH